MGGFSPGLGSRTTPGKKKRYCQVLANKIPHFPPWGLQTPFISSAGQPPALQLLIPVPPGTQAARQGRHKPSLDHCFSGCQWGRDEHLSWLDPGQAIAANPGLSSVHAGWMWMPLSSLKARRSAALPEDDSSQQPRDGLGCILETSWISVGVIEVGFDWPLPFRQLM